MNGLYNTGATDLKSIFLAPLEAVITADIDLSKKITEFIAHYGFEKKHSGEEDDTGRKRNDEFGKLRMVTFSFLNNKGKMEKCSIPVLSLIQLPLLCIKDADFNMQVKMITVDEGEDLNLLPSLTTDQGLAAPVPKKVTLLKGYLSPDSDKISESLKANMKVKLRMGQSDVPGGLLKLLAMMNDITELKNNEND